MVLLQCCGVYDPPPRFDVGMFSNGESEFIALYDIATGYVQLYGPSDAPEQYGYNYRSNRWGWGSGPKNPLVIKRALRPWIKGLDDAYGRGS